MSPPAFGSQQPCDGAQLHAARFRVACPQRDKPWVLASAILGSSLAFIEGSVVNLALPAIQHELDIDSAAVQWVMNAYLLTLGSFMLVGGSLGDRIGLRRIFIIGNAVFGLGAFGCAIASSLPLLIVARCVQGLGGALLVAVRSAPGPAHPPSRPLSGRCSVARLSTCGVGLRSSGWSRLSPC
jgi:MFS family permease